MTPPRNLKFHAPWKKYFGVCVFMIVFLGGLFCSTITIKRSYFLSVGKKKIGEVFNTHTTKGIDRKGKETIEYHLTYRFHADGKKWVFGDALITRMQYDQILGQEILEVTYDPEDPSRNMVEAYMYPDFGPWLSLILFVSLTIGTFAVLHEQARQNRILRHGDVVDSIVLKTMIGSPVGNSGRAPFFVRVAYRYRGRKYVELSKQLPLGLEVGDHVELYLDPRNPKSFVVGGEHGNAVYKFIS